MFELLGITPQQLFSQVLLGLINGAFYAMLSLGLAVIFGMLNVVNFAHGALYMAGAFVSWILLDRLGPGLAWLWTQPGFAPLDWLGPGIAWVVQRLGPPPEWLAQFKIGYWGALLVAPLLVGLLGVVIERALLRWLYKLDHLYGLLLTFGLALIVEGLFRNEYGTSGQPYDAPALLQGGRQLGFMYMPNYRVWVVLASLAVCIATWFLIERTKLGAYLRAATENAALVQAFGINVPRLLTFTYAGGVGLAALAGVLAAPMEAVTPQMGSNIIIIVFAVVVIGGMGSIMGSVVTGFALGVIEGLTKVFFPEASNTVIFVIMAIVLLIKPAGLFGRTA